MTEYHCLEPFDVDHGELDGLTPQMCFVLGYELCGIRDALNRPEPIAVMLHAENRERVEKRCKASGREYKLSWMPGDCSESWMQLDVGPIE